MSSQSSFLERFPAALQPYDSRSHNPQKFPARPPIAPAASQDSRITKLEEVLQQQMSERLEDQQKLLELEARLRNLESNLNHIGLDSIEGPDIAGTSAKQVTSKGGVTMADASDEFENAAVTFSEQFKILQHRHHKTESRLEVLEAVCATLPKKDDALFTADVEAADTPAQGQPGGLDTESGGQMTMEIQMSAEKRSNMNSMSSQGLLENVYGEYVFEHSIHDSLFLIQVSIMSPKQSIIIVLSWLCHAVMVIVSIIIIGADEFSEAPFRDKNLYLKWRASYAHSAYNADSLTQTSLVARVCNDDASLPVAVGYRDLIKDAEKYWPYGYILANTAILLWVICCALEIRKSLNFLAAICSIPKGKRTTIAGDNEGFEFKALSSTRLMLGIYIAVVRCIIAMCIATYGSVWLANTVNLESLLLNASALGFILDIDENIYGVMAPFRLIRLLNTIKPVCVHPKAINNHFTTILVLLIGGFMTWMNIGPISTQRSSMDDAIATLCGTEGSHQLVQAVNSLGWVIYTKDMNTWSSTYTRRELDIVSDLIFNPSEGEQYAYEVGGSVEDLKIAAGRSIDEAVNRFGCDDYNAVDRAKTTVGKRIWAATGNASLHGLQNCQDAKAYCRDPGTVGKNVRFMCAITCGCHEWHAGLWDLASSSNGCPALPCRNWLLRQLANRSFGCEDLSVTELQNTGWQAMVDRMRLNQDISESAHSNLSKFGCQALQEGEIPNRAHICSMTESTPNNGAAPFCPESCRCTTARIAAATTTCPSLCPAACCTSKEVVKEAAVLLTPRRR